jgi:hypothetical protein
MRNAHCRTLIIPRKLKNVINETQTLYNLKYGEKYSKTCKMKNAHCRTWRMARKRKTMGNEKHTVYDLEYGVKHCKS